MYRSPRANFYEKKSKITPIKIRFSTLYKYNSVYHKVLKEIEENNRQIWIKNNSFIHQRKVDALLVILLVEVD